MTRGDTRERAEVFRATAQRRLSESAALLKRMGVSEDEYLRVMLNALVTSQRRAKPGAKTLADCTPESVELALIRCLNAGLVPDGEEAYLIPLRSGSDVECEVWPGIVGRLKLARAATPGLSIRAQTVYQDDDFEHEEGLRPRLVHRPARTGAKTEDRIVAVYAVAHVPGQDVPEMEVLYRADIDRHRAFSRAKGGPWDTGHYGEMGERSAMALVLKRLPRRATDIREPDLDHHEPAASSPVSAPAAVEHLPSRPASFDGNTVRVEEPAKQQEKTRRRRPTKASAPAPVATGPDAGPPVDFDDESPF